MRKIKKRKTMKKKLIFALIFILFTMSTEVTFANRKDNNRITTFLSIQEYLKENVFPNIKHLRNDLDKLLNNAEKSQIEEIRKEIRDEVKIRQNAGVSFVNFKLFGEELSDDQVKVMKETRERFYDIILKAMIITKKHEQEIQDLLKTEEKNRENWKNDIQKIVKTNAPKRALVLNPVLKQNIDKLLPAEKVINIMFLLWNPEESFFNELN